MSIENEDQDPADQLAMGEEKLSRDGVEWVLSLGITAKKPFHLYYCGSTSSWEFHCPHTKCDVIHRLSEAQMNAFPESGRLCSCGYMVGPPLKTEVAAWRIRMVAEEALAQRLDHSGAMETYLRWYREEVEGSFANKMLSASGLPVTKPASPRTVLDLMQQTLENMRRDCPEDDQAPKNEDAKEREATRSDETQDDPGTVEIVPVATEAQRVEAARRNPKLYAVGMRRHEGQRILVMLPSVPSDLGPWPASAFGLPITYLPLTRDGERWRKNVETWVREGLVRCAVVCAHGVRGDLLSGLAAPLKTASVPTKNIGNASLAAVKDALAVLETEAL